MPGGPPGFPAILSLDEAVSLAYALALRIADNHGIRGLAIKGPVLEDQALRRDHRSIDADIWVDPAHLHDFLNALGPLGWLPHVPEGGASVIPLHSAAHIHPLWPCEIDVHDRFPGFFADPQAVFEALWRRRASVTIAGQPIPCTDVVGSAAIMALHALRDPQMKSTEVTRVIETLRTTLSPEQKVDLADLAIETGATDTLRRVLTALGFNDLPVTATPEDLRAWRLRTTAERATSVPWVYALWEASPRRWPGLLWHAIWSTEEEVRFWWPGYPETRWGLFRARMARLADGLRSLPAAVRMVWQTRRER